MKKLFVVFFSEMGFVGGFFFSLSKDFSVIKTQSLSLFLWKSKMPSEGQAKDRGVWKRSGHTRKTFHSWDFANTI